MAQTDSRPMKAVVNSTPLIALSMLNHLFVLKDLFDEIFVPAESFPLPPELLGLDTGEMDVILLAREVKADWVLIDEKLARRVAKGLGVKLKGTLGLLLIACRTGLVSREEARAAAQEIGFEFISYQRSLIPMVRRSITDLMTSRRLSENSDPTAKE